MKKALLFLTLLSMPLFAASCCQSEPQTTEATAEVFEKTALSETTTPVGFERISALESPEFIENLWLKEEEEVYYQRSAVIAKGHASNLAEYHIFGEHYSYYITAFDFTLDEVFYGEEVNAGDTVSVGNFNSSYEYDSSLPTLKENGEYILFLHSTESNEQVGGLVDYNMPSPLFNCIPIVGDYCEVKDLFSDYGESVKKSSLLRGRKTLAYEALQNGEDVELETVLVNESYSALASEEAKYIENQGIFETRLSTVYVVNLSEFEETLRRRIGELK